MDFAARISAKRAERAEREPAYDYAAIDARGEPFRAAVSAALMEMAATAEFAEAFGPLPMQETVRPSGEGQTLWEPPLREWRTDFANQDEERFRMLLVSLTLGADGDFPRCTVTTPPRAHGFVFSWPRLDVVAETPAQAAELVTDTLAEYLVEISPRIQTPKAPGR